MIYPQTGVITTLVLFYRRVESLSKTEDFFFRRNDYFCLLLKEVFKHGRVSDNIMNKELLKERASEKTRTGFNPCLKTCEHTSDVNKTRMNIRRNSTNTHKSGPTKTTQSRRHRGERERCLIVVVTVSTIRIMAYRECMSIMSFLSFQSLSDLSSLCACWPIGLLPHSTRHVTGSCRSRMGRGCLRTYPWSRSLRRDDIFVV